MGKIHIVEIACMNFDRTLKHKATVRYESNSIEQLIGKCYHAMQALSAIHPECRMVAEFPTDADAWIRVEHCTDYANLEAWQNTPDKPDFPDHNATNSPW